MASYRDVYTREIEGLFSNVGKSPFAPGGSQDSVPQEDGGRIQPSGWVMNSDGAGTATVVIDAAGIAVTGGKITVATADGTSLITGENLIMTRASGRIPSGVELGIANTKVTASGIVVNDGAIDRATLGAINGSYGLKVVNSGATVIIDGTSNVFKIIATGTLNITGPDGTTTLGALTTGGVNIATGLTYRPAFLQFVDTGGYATALPFASFFNDLTPAGHAARNVWGYTSVVNTNQTRIEWGWQAFINDSVKTWPFRYYILKEAAI